MKVPDHSGKLIYQNRDDASLKHEPTRRTREDEKRGRRQTPTRNAKAQRPMPAVDNPEYEDHLR
jgi:hypothetical protein